MDGLSGSYIWADAGKGMAKAGGFKFLHCSHTHKPPDKVKVSHHCLCCPAEKAFLPNIQLIAFVSIFSTKQNKKRPVKLLFASLLLSLQPLLVSTGHCSFQFPLVTISLWNDDAPPTLSWGVNTQIKQSCSEYIHTFVTIALNKMMLRELSGPKQKGSAA